MRQSLRRCPPSLRRPYTTHRKNLNLSPHERFSSSTLIISVPSRAPISKPWRGRTAVHVVVMTPTPGSNCSICHGTPCCFRTAHSLRNADHTTDSPRGAGGSHKKIRAFLEPERSPSPANEQPQVEHPMNDASSLCEPLHWLKSGSPPRANHRARATFGSRRVEKWEMSQERAFQPFTKHYFQ